MMAWEMMLTTVMGVQKRERSRHGLSASRFSLGAISAYNDGLPVCPKGDNLVCEQIRNL